MAEQKIEYRQKMLKEMRIYELNKEPCRWTSLILYLSL